MLLRRGLGFHGGTVYGPVGFSVGFIKQVTEKQQQHEDKRGSDAEQGGTVAPGFPFRVGVMGCDVCLLFQVFQLRCPFR